MIKTQRTLLRIVSLLLIAIAILNEVYLVSLLGVFSLLVSFTWLYMPENERVEAWAARIITAKTALLAMEKADAARYSQAEEMAKKALQHRNIVL